MIWCQCCCLGKTCWKEVEFDWLAKILGMRLEEGGFGSIWCCVENWSRCRDGWWIWDVRDGVIYNQCTFQNFGGGFTSKTLFSEPPVYPTFIKSQMIPFLNVSGIRQTYQTTLILEQRKSSRICHLNALPSIAGYVVRMGIMPFASFQSPGCRGLRPSVYVINYAFLSSG